MSHEVAILGVGMHPWGKWGRNFVEYGVHAIKAALKDADVDYRDVEFVAGGDGRSGCHGASGGWVWFIYPTVSPMSGQKCHRMSEVTDE